MDPAEFDYVKVSSLLHNQIRQDTLKLLMIELHSKFFETSEACPNALLRREKAHP